MLAWIHENAASEKEAAVDLQFMRTRETPKLQKNKKLCLSILQRIAMFDVLEGVVNNREIQNMFWIDIGIADASLCSSFRNSAKQYLL